MKIDEAEKVQKALLKMADQKWAKWGDKEEQITELLETRKIDALGMQNKLKKMKLNKVRSI